MHLPKKFLAGSAAKGWSPTWTREQERGWENKRKVWKEAEESKREVSRQNTFKIKHLRKRDNMEKQKSGRGGGWDKKESRREGYLPKKGKRLAEICPKSQEAKTCAIRSKGVQKKGKVFNRFLLIFKPRFWGENKAGEGKRGGDNKKGKKTKNYEHGGKPPRKKTPGLDKRKKGKDNSGKGFGAKKHALWPRFSMFTKRTRGKKEEKRKLEKQNKMEGSSRGKCLDGKGVGLEGTQGQKKDVCNRNERKRDPKGKKGFVVAEQ